MKYFILANKIFFLAALLVCGVVALVWTPVFSTAKNAAPFLAARPLQQSDLPAEGWQVCMVGGIEYIPAVGENRQTFEICHSAGWRLKTYCTNPGMTAPLQGAKCSDVGGGLYWCGANAQQLQILMILDTPAPAHTPTVTVTVTRTPTPTPTRTITRTATITTTSFPATLTPITTLTPGGLDITVTATRTSLPDLKTATAYPYRPRPGGPGNTGPLLTLLLGAVLAGGAGLVIHSLRVK